MLEFIKNDFSLLLLYEPDFRHEVVRQKLDANELHLKRTFFLGKENESTEIEISEDEFCFKIGELKGKYYLLDKEILATENNFFVSKNIRIEQKFFIAYQNVSILKKIDDLVDCDIYITDVVDNIPGHIPYEEFQLLISTFPNSIEVSKYVYSRISNSLKNYVDGLGEVTSKYEKYLNKRTAKVPFKVTPELQILSLELFRKAYRTLKQMLLDVETYNEKDWQLAIKDIICILYPKYVLVKREVDIGTDGRSAKKPDFLLIDSLGFVDVLEIKKPNNQRLITKSRYRNNYVADRDLSGAIVQIEKYIYCMNRDGKQLEKKLKEHLAQELSTDVCVRVVNPQGILLLGRDNDISGEQKEDLEIIKRQHKNIVDIMTYDDLLKRIKNIIDHLSVECKDGAS